MPAQALLVGVPLPHLAEGALGLLVNRPPSLLDRPCLSHFVHRLPLGRVERVPIVRCLASLLEPCSQVGGGIGLGALERTGGPPLEPPERSEPQRTSEPCQSPPHAAMLL